MNSFLDIILDWGVGYALMGISFIVMAVCCWRAFIVLALNTDLFIQVFTKLVDEGNFDRAIKLCHAANYSPVPTVVLAGAKAVRDDRAGRDNAEVIAEAARAMLEARQAPWTHVRRLSALMAVNAVLALACTVFFYIFKDRFWLDPDIEFDLIEHWAVVVSLAAFLGTLGGLRSLRRTYKAIVSAPMRVLGPIVKGGLGVEMTELAIQRALSPLTDAEREHLEAMGQDEPMRADGFQLTSSPPKNTPSGSVLVGSWPLYDALRRGEWSVMWRKDGRAALQGERLTVIYGGGEPAVMDLDQVRAVHLHRWPAGFGKVWLEVSLSSGRQRISLQSKVPQSAVPSMVPKLQSRAPVVEARALYAIWSCLRRIEIERGGDLPAVGPGQNKAGKSP